MDFPRYESYKDSGVEWLGEIPSHWQERRMKSFGMVKRGASPRPIADPRYFDDSGEYGWVRIEDVTKSNKYLTHTKEKLSELGSQFSVKQHSGDFFLSIAGSVGKPIISKIKCCIHDGFVWFDWFNPLNKEFLYYIFLLDEPFVGLGKHGTQLNLNTSTIGNIRIPVPPLEEQERIARFLDEKTAVIDTAIAKKERLIALLEEQKQILVNTAVTRGLNPHTPTRPSGIDWIGDIPAHWKVKRAKFIFYEVDSRSETGQEELLSVSHMTGVTPRSEKNVFMFMAESYAGSKVCQKDDLIINIMWAWMGALGVSDRTGIVSPSYGVYRQQQQGTFNPWYLEHLLRSGQYVAEYNRRSTGLHSSRLRLYSHMFFDMEVSIPPRQEQDEIETLTKEKTSLLDKTIGATKKEIDSMNELRSILIAEAVTGKIKI